VTTAPQLLESLARAGAVAVLAADAATIARAVVDAGAGDVLVLPCSAAAAAEAATASGDAVVVADGYAVAVGPTLDDLAVYESVALLEAATESGVPELLAVVRDLVSARTHVVGNADPRSLEAEVHALARELASGVPAVVTVLVGAAVGARRAAKLLTALLEAASPELETFIVVGGQPETALLVRVQ